MVASPFPALAVTGTARNMQAMPRPPIDFSRLTPDERLELIGQLWDSLDPAPEPGAEQLAELERRSRDLDAHPDASIPAADAIAHLRTRLT